MFVCVGSVRAVSPCGSDHLILLYFLGHWSGCRVILRVNVLATHLASINIALDRLV